ncbi:MAG: type II toxin-antitoxin system VapB family antitoxin [Gammaproteobacteria bacterium]|nr:type II toxin-antitoxin system VapB family antitoxin [Gammaproteobacteria bacterium]
MKTTIEIDDELMNEAINLNGSKTKRETVALGLKAFVRRKKQENIRRFRGHLAWVGDLDEMRSSRSFRRNTL